MLVTVLLDAGVAMIMTALIAVLAAAVNGTGLELGVYVLFGGIAGIVTVRRGERLAVFLQAGVAVFVVNVLVVITFALLGNQDALGLVQLLRRPRPRRPAARRSRPWAASPSSGPCSGS